MTIGRLIIMMEQKLSAAHIQNASLDAEVLTGLAFKKDREYLLSHNKTNVPPRVIRRAHILLHRRLKYEPIAHIRGWQMFYTHRLKVNRHTLIPRPETELFIEKMLQSFPRSWRGTFVDIGTGSGALAISLAAEFRKAKIIGIDCSKDALKIARANARLNEYTAFCGNITYLCGNLLAPFISRLNRQTITLDKPLIIVANLPYVPTNVWQKSEPQVRNFEPRTALDGGTDGLTLYRALMMQLKKAGILPAELWCEIGCSQKRLFTDLTATFFPYAQTEYHKDLNRCTRLARVIFGTAAIITFSFPFLLPLCQQFLLPFSFHLPLL